MKNKRIGNRIVRYMCAKGIFNLLRDKSFLKLKYWATIGENLNIENPKGFNEKIQWLKLNDKKPLYTQLVDKYEVKKYIADTIGSQYIIPTYGIWNKFNDINFDELPNQFVIKCTHDSGGLYIVKDKNNFNYKKAKSKINRSLRHNYYKHGREWPYKNVKPRIIIEEYMEDKKKHELVDYKVMCFNGIPKMIFTCTDRFKDDLKVTFFDLKWNKLPFERHYPSSTEKIEPPYNLTKMLELSKILATGKKFVRIDWYEINKKLYFGEFTFYPGSGFEEFTPKKWDNILGDMMDL